MCRGIQPTDDTFGCSPTSAICMMNRKGYHYSLGTLQSMKVKSISKKVLKYIIPYSQDLVILSVNQIYVAVTLLPIITH